MLEINQISLTGEVVSGSKNDKGLYLKVKQMVCGKMETVFTVFVPAKSIPEVDLREKDLVLVNNGLIYKNNGEFTVRVTRPDQLQLIKRCHDLGEVSAEEVF